MYYVVLATEGNGKKGNQKITNLKLIPIKTMELVGAGRRPSLTFLQISHLFTYKIAEVRRTSLLMINNTRIYVVMAQQFMYILCSSHQSAP